MERKKTKKVFLGMLVLASMGLAGCSTVATMAQHHNLEVQSKVSNSIFLQPLAPDQQRVYVQIHNTSAKPGLNIKTAVDQELQSQGWTVVSNPNKANVILQANILQAGKSKQNAIQSAVESGYGGGVFGSGVTGAGIAGLAGGSIRDAGAAALASGAADYVGGLLVKDVYYSLTADVQVLRRGLNGQTYTVTHTRNSGNDSASQAIQNVISMARGNQATVSSSSNTDSYTDTSHFKQYQTRIVASAEKVNLDWQEAAPALRDKLADTIGGIL